ncbi:hypothetical protein P3X46_011774 [Hevea brasiliensis]|uniref:Glycolipid transfer protein domain-containing protein n=1 Tax=Hevea brasiliensis TaxID=3981 RepID=A0ABQ9MAM3_HEVBR|nr:hypothetical protein P3X46_011774 [Hevea brasiliensis]
MDGGTVFTASLQGIQQIKSRDGEILTRPFLDVCKTILPVIDSFVSAMSFAKSDIGGNISRLENKYSSNPSEFNLLYSIVRSEIDSKTVSFASFLGCSRAMDFLVELFRNLLAHPDWRMTQVCSYSYIKTLKKWHNWLASSRFSVASKLAPDRKKFMDVISGKGDVNADVEKFCTNFSPFLDENYKFLLRFNANDLSTFLQASVGVDDMKA